MDPITIVSIAAFILVMYFVTKKPANTPRADFNSVLAFIKRRQKRNKEVTAESLEELEDACAAMNVPVTYREDAEYLVNNLPKKASELKSKAIKSSLLWKMLSDYAKKASVLAGIVIFIAVYSLWAEELWNATVAMVKFLISLGLPLLYVAAGVAILLAIAYTFKKTASVRKARYNKKAAATEARIPDAQLVYSVINKK